MTRKLVAGLALAGFVASFAGSAAAIRVVSCPPGDTGVLVEHNGRSAAVCTDLV